MAAIAIGAIDDANISELEKKWENYRLEGGKKASNSNFQF